MLNKNFISLTLSNFLMCCTYYAMISVLPIYLVCELHATKSQVGTVLAAYTIASVFMRPFAGFMLNRFGRRTVFLLVLSLYSALFLGYFVAVSIAALVVLRFVQGLTWGVTTISGATIAVDIIPAQHRGQGIGYFTLSTTLGMAIGPLIGLFVMHQWGYKAMFVSGVVVSGLSLLSAYFVKLQKRFRLGRRVSFSWRNLFDTQSLLPACNMLVIMITYGGLLSFIALYGREIGIHNPSSFFLIFACGIALSRITVGKVFDKKGPNLLLTLCLLLLIFCFPFLALMKNAIGFYTSALIIGFGIGVVFPIFQTIINNIANVDRRPAANSTLYTALDLGMALGMSIAGFVAQHFSISAIFFYNAVLCVIGLLIFKLFVLDRYNIAMARI